ncbi:MAG TPA: Asp-tRNA(Asn)/Glu-tRNA(Gln) amidotransferase subunit GatB [Kofleriaceae bacterium]|nr:Asp-tRNA(Asn)/Glu-tRNA(Gln) amidotransferase subunit GatB [Kofleriaceae bacterium]
MSDAHLYETYEAVIGLEVHVQLATHSKAFSSSAVAFGAPANSLTDPVVLGMPGTLPVFNRAALELALKLGIATASKIRAKSRFARKHYFYPDQPKGYQISQYDEPLCEDGHLELILPARRSESGELQSGGGEVKRVRLERIHLEEDAGKNTHVGQFSHVDLNRAGVALVEVVSAPELTSAEEAAEFMRALNRLVRWLEISEADMEKGQMRCDANVSVRLRGEDRLGTRTELKNINSFRFVQNAVEHEILRQMRIVDSGGRVTRETRLWDADSGTSASMRSKEEANDYRYFPDPDLPPLVVDGSVMASILKTLPELPTARFTRYRAQHGLAADDARTLISDRALADYFDLVCKVHPGESSGRTIANWMLTELLGALNADGKTIAESPMVPATLSELVRLVETGAISGKIGKDVFAESYKTGEAPGRIVEAKGLQQISDEAALWEIVDRIVGANQKQADEYAKGKDGLFGFFVGAVMRETKGRANPVITSDLLHKRLGR